MSSTTSLPPIFIDPGEDRRYPYYMASLDTLPGLMADAALQVGRCLIITDERVGPVYAPALIASLERTGWTPKTIMLPAGETTKHPLHLQAIYDEALTWGIDRKTPLIALGGGVIGDLGGFAAATLLRGIPLVQVPTTLISQVDSAIGGKTGINHASGKNLVGSFYQPAFVCADLATLATLPEREWTSGLAEVVKHALIADEAFISTLERTWEDVLLRKPAVIGPMIHRAAAIKADVVSHDEKEAGLRAILNFGHTFGHAIERIAGYGSYTHGEAVATGMRMALRLSRSLHPALDMQRADAIVSRIPVQAQPLSCSSNILIDAMHTDKKVLAGKLRFVLLDRIGHAYMASNAPLDAVRDAIDLVLQDEHARA